ncbi:MAG TPA: ISC system 2Fe-2S type ferredoxin [Burkholderiales bacterium]|nr:ISC system 2Fe-2S type ferredoxin [Betaproteobacteria bacterium]HQR53544.1 ISC system 2Fe-2S type ferredoxin [Burkholderiales bacterium]
MPRLTVLPHKSLCPKGTSFDVASGTTICDALLAHGIEIEHACEKSCACATCHVIVREGFDDLPAASEREEDQLGEAWGLTLQSRLACRATVADGDLVVEIPKYSLNLARE